MIILPTTFMEILNKSGNAEFIIFNKKMMIYKQKLVKMVK